MRRIVTLAIITVAGQLLAGYLSRRQRRYARNRRHFLVTQGGSQLRPTGDELTDAVVSVLMGGLVLDMRETQLTERPGADTVKEHQRD